MRTASRHGSTMEIFPSIGLKDGKCVCLRQGDAGAARFYDIDPVEAAMDFAAAGANWVHIVDLDGAHSEKMHHFEAITRIVNETPLKVQAGGGVRDASVVESLLDIGVSRVVVGCMATRSKSEVMSWIKNFGAQNIILAFDIKYIDDEPEVLCNGWRSGSQQLLWDVLDAYDCSGIRSITCADTVRYGMLTGSNHDLYKKIREHWPELEILASGGIDSIADLMVLKNECRASGAIIGMALYEKRLDLIRAIGSVKQA